MSWALLSAGGKLRGLSLFLVLICNCFSVLQSCYTFKFKLIFCRTLCNALSIIIVKGSITFLAQSVFATSIIRVIHIIVVVATFRLMFVSV